VESNIATELIINGERYVHESFANELAPELDGMPYCIIRTYSAGVFAGYVQQQDGKYVVIRKARRLWYWEGAASLSQLAVDGVSKPDKCKFPAEVDCIEVTEMIEKLYCTEKAKQSIAGVPVWEAK
jgi:hypothetical protein